jgi:riboflavin transporter 2
LAALVPGVLALGQGLAHDPGCRNTSSNSSWSLEPLPITPNYSVSVYFVFMFVLLCISTLCFSLLHFTNAARQARKNNPNSAQSNNKQTNNVNESKYEKPVLLFIIFTTTFICYGVMPGLQSYSTLPYGNIVFNLAVNLSKFWTPILFSIINQ